MEGRITKLISNKYTVDVNGVKYDCIPRGKFRHNNITPLVGDIVTFDSDELVIEDIRKRYNYLDRPNVANVDIALIVTSLAKPKLSLTLLDKELTLVTSKKIKPIICFTKKDLLNKEDEKELKEIVKYYKSIGIDVLFNDNLLKLKWLLKGKTVVLTGQSGAGKSTLLNRLNKNLKLETKPISDALGRGVHTTRHTEIYYLNKIYFIDTPGFSSLDLNISKEELRDSFIEFSNRKCKYKDCYHKNEDGCGIIPEVGKSILPSRYLNYIEFLRSIDENSSKLFK